MTKIIAAVIIALVLWGGWELFFYWERVNNEKEDEKKHSVTAVQPDSLAGLPPELDNALRVAQTQGADGLGSFLKTYGNRIQDPRKAWLDLDYCQMIARENTAEAKRVFADVKKRTPHNSPVWPRIQQLEKTYD